MLSDSKRDDDRSVRTSRVDEKESQQESKSDHKSLKSNPPKSLESLTDRRNKKWLSFARSKVSFGFKHLPPNSIPNMSPDTRGISICLERITGWTVPIAVIRELQRSNSENGL